MGAGKIISEYINTETVLGNVLAEIVKLIKSDKIRYVVEAVLP